MALSGNRASPGRLWGGGLALGLLTFLAYWPVLHCGFVWDDDHFFVQNPLIRASDGLYRFWCTTQATDYWPVVSTSFWCEWRLWGLDPLGYHVTNVLMHIVSVLLLWAVARRLRVPGAYLMALLFALHPVNVESVAWITQRKNLLALIFFLLSLDAYLKAEGWGQMARPQRNGGWYVLSLGAFALALLSKGSVAVLPAVLLGLVAWHRRPTLADLGRLVPFGVVGAVFTGVDIWFQRHGTAEVIRQVSGLQRILGVGNVVWFYLAKAIWPFHLAFCYPQWALRPELWTAWLPWLGGLTMAGAVMGAVPAWRRPLGSGLSYFLLMLVPVMGFTDVYFMKYSLVADHYQHLALIGVMALAGVGWEGWRRRVQGPERPVWIQGLPWLVAGICILLFAGLTWRQCGIYRDRETLFRAAIRANPECWMAESNLGLDLINAGRYAEALSHCEAAVRLEPTFAEAQNNLGIADAGLGRLPASIAQFQQAIRLKPFYPEAYNNLGNAYRLSKNIPAAIRAYVQALTQRPAYAEGRNNLGVALMDLGRLPEAIAQLREAVRLAPGYQAARENLDLALRKAAFIAR